ncbi:MAG: protein translocase subunit SecF [Candidatus Uhrbacteria bacterium]|nr:protein translocase subunit SecF [Candidatus Uhrbacteria bacterium]
MNIIKLRSVWYALSGILVLGSLFCVAVFGLKFGIDFTGGSLLSVRFDHRPTSVEIERAMDGLDVGSVVIQPVGDTDVNIRMKSLDDVQHQEVFGRLQKAFASAKELRFDSIGPAIGAELRAKSVTALIVALIAIGLYIAYSFRGVSGAVQNWKYGIVTLISALHDTIIPIGVFAVLGKQMGLEVDTTFVVAILTVLGYSINDTIVVLDRIRENLRRMSGSFEHIVTESLRQTYVRSINTSMTTLLSLVAIFFFGGMTLRPFALALIIGIVVGTYSSIFIASPILVTWNKLSKKS